MNARCVVTVVNWVTSMTIATNVWVILIQVVVEVVAKDKVARTILQVADNVVPLIFDRAFFYSCSTAPVTFSWARHGCDTNFNRSYFFAKR
ncbi:hypothetical protein Ancab_011924 [Ancistrocladus abbreviatus]